MAKEKFLSDMIGNRNMNAYKIVCGKGNSLIKLITLAAPIKIGEVIKIFTRDKNKKIDGEIEITKNVKEIEIGESENIYYIYTEDEKKYKIEFVRGVIP